MKTRSSIKSFKNRKDCIVTSRMKNGKRRLFVRCKSKPKFNVKQ